MDHDWRSVHGAWIIYAESRIIISILLMLNMYVVNVGLDATQFSLFSFSILIVLAGRLVKEKIR